MKKISFILLLIFFSCTVYGHSRQINSIICIKGKNRTMLIPLEQVVKIYSPNQNCIIIGVSWSFFDKKFYYDTKEEKDAALKKILEETRELKKRNEKETQK